jgi:uncharacterized protein (DUF58 family)
MAPSTVGPALPARLRRIELAVSRRVVGRREGDHASSLLGRGVELGEARPYVPGDDVRRLDWSLLARTGEPHVRDAIAERDLDVAILLDRSASLDFGTVGWRKADLALSVASAVASLAIRQRDRVGIMAAGAGEAEMTPIRGGRGHLISTLGRAARTPISGAVDLGEAVDRLGRTMPRRGLAVVVSDFLGPIDRWPDALGRLGRRHDVLAIEVIDPREIALPDVGLLTVEDPETGRQRTIDTSDLGFRVRLAEVAGRRRAATASAITRAGATHLVLRTDRDWIGPLLGALLARRHRPAGQGARAAAVGVPAR